MFGMVNAASRAIANAIHYLSDIEGKNLHLIR
jgi:hypothetical protein